MYAVIEANGRQLKVSEGDGIRVDSIAGAPDSQIVCAGVSALVQSAAHGLSAHCAAAATVRDDPEGDFVIELLEPANARAQAVLETALSGLRAIAREYPDHLAVRVERTGARRSRTEHTRPRKGA